MNKLFRSLTILVLAFTAATATARIRRPTTVCEKMIGRRQWMFTPKVVKLIKPYRALAKNTSPEEFNAIFARVDEFLETAKNDPLATARDISEGNRPLGLIDGTYRPTWYEQTFADTKAFTFEGQDRIQKFLEDAGAKAARERPLENRAQNYLKRFAIANTPMAVAAAAEYFYSGSVGVFGFMLLSVPTVFANTRAYAQIEFDASANAETLGFQKFQEILDGTVPFAPGDFALVERAVSSRTNLFFLLSRLQTGELKLDVIWKAESGYHHGG